jgi:Ca2+-binding RTX toxin-like protein
MTARYGTPYKNTMGFWGLVDELHGLGGDDILDGRWGSGRMYGGMDNDTYYIDGTNDQVIELAGEGTKDKVFSSVLDYTLPANVEQLELIGGSAARSGTGNGLNNLIIGNEYGNDLVGGGGADILEGGLGNDNYWVDQAGDAVIEYEDEGTDTVYSTAFTFTLDSNVERLVLTGSAEIDGIGNELANRITGNGASNELRGEQGNDDLDGRGGADDMYGGRQDDTYVVDNVADEVFELPAEVDGYDTVNAWVDYTLPDNVEKLVLFGIPDILGDGPGSGAFNGTGNNLANEIVGNLFANELAGRRGSDTLTGGGDADTFVFAHSDAFDDDYEQDVVTDFQLDLDKVDVSDTPDMNGWNDLFNNGDGDFMEQVGNNVVIHTTTEDTITLLNVQLSALTQNDFMF